MMGQPRRRFVSSGRDAPVRLLQGACLACTDSNVTPKRKPRQHAHATTLRNSNPASVNLAKAEVVAAAALIAFVVTVVTAHVLDRWWRY